MAVEKNAKRLFKDFLLELWNGGTRDEDQLFCIGEGKNVIPTIHIKDLTTMLCKLIAKKPDPQEYPYILSIDKAGPGQTQLAIVESIAKKLGIANIKKLKQFEIPDIETREWTESLTININMMTSEFWADLIKPSEWYCEKGFAENIDKIFDEYKIMRGLRSIRILLIGPPAAGKTHFADYLNKKYGISAIKTKELLEEVKGLKDETSMKILEELDKMKKQKIEELEAIAKKKKSKEVINPDDIKIRFTPEMLYKIYIRKLSQRNFLNKGYILDGFPKTFQDACNIFLELPPKKEPPEEEQPIDYEKCKIREIMPNKVILFEGKPNEFNEIYSQR